MSDTPVYSQGKFDPKHPVISQSFLNTWADCPFLAHKIWIEGKRIAPGIAALQGTATDKAVTYGAENMIKRGEDAPLAEKIDLAETTFVEGVKDHQVWEDDNLDELREQTKSLVKAHHEQIAKSLKPVRTQEAILIKGEEYDLAGTVDLIEVGDQPSDLKTAGQRNQFPTKKGMIQSTLYTRLLGLKYNKPAPTKFRFDVLVKNKTVVTERVEVPVAAPQQKLLDHIIENTRQELKTSLETGNFRLAPNDSWRCASSGKWCGFLYNGCPKGEKQ